RRRFASLIAESSDSTPHLHMQWVHRGRRKFRPLCKHHHIARRADTTVLRKTLPGGYPSLTTLRIAAPRGHCHGLSAHPGLIFSEILRIPQDPSARATSSGVRLPSPRRGRGSGANSRLLHVLSSGRSAASVIGDQSGSPASTNAAQ